MAAAATTTGWGRVDGMASVVERVEARVAESVDEREVRRDGGGGVSGGSVWRGGGGGGGGVLRSHSPQAECRVYKCTIDCLFVFLHVSASCAFLCAAQRPVALLPTKPSGHPFLSLTSTAKPQSHN
jgi:hypothetical protein